MKSTFISALLITIFAGSTAQAQITKKDSLAVVKRYVELLDICKKGNIADPSANAAGLFSKAAPYIVYRGDDEKRAWKTFCNYAVAEEKRGVDEVCTEINETVNRDPNYKIVQYHTEKESEGIWHLLMVTYVKAGKEKNAVFAFLKIKGQFGLGDID